MGSTILKFLKEEVHGDHPHIHGEHSSSPPPLVESSGSPPYTWGAPEHVYVMVTDNRITPIYMGSTSGKSYH